MKWGKAETIRRKRAAGQMSERQRTAARREVEKTVVAPEKAQA